MQIDVIINKQFFLASSYPLTSITDIRKSLQNVLNSHSLVYNNTTYQVVTTFCGLPVHTVVLVADLTNTSPSPLKIVEIKLGWSLKGSCSCVEVCRNTSFSVIRVDVVRTGSRSCVCVCVWVCVYECVCVSVYEGTHRCVYMATVVTRTRHSVISTLHTLWLFGARIIVVLFRQNSSLRVFQEFTVGKKCVTVMCH